MSRPADHQQLLGRIGHDASEGPEAEGSAERLDLAWFSSVIPNKFYGGSVPLPHALLMSSSREGSRCRWHRSDTWRKIRRRRGARRVDKRVAGGQRPGAGSGRARIEPVSLAWSQVIDNPGH